MIHGILGTSAIEKLAILKILSGIDVIGAEYVPGVGNVLTGHVGIPIVLGISNGKFKAESDESILELCQKLP